MSETRKASPAATNLRRRLAELKTRDRKMQAAYRELRETERLLALETAKLYIAVTGNSLYTGLALRTVLGASREIASINFLGLRFSLRDELSVTVTHASDSGETLSLKLRLGDEVAVSVKDGRSATAEFSLQLRVCRTLEEAKAWINFDDDDDDGGILAGGARIRGGTRHPND